MDKRSIEFGKTFLGCMINEITMPNLMRICKVGAVDFVIIDCEHGSFTTSELSAMIAVANSIDLTVIVRIPNNSREWTLKVLEMGADGLLLPMANTAEIIAKVVEYGKYRPVGNRGLAKTRAHCNYNMKDVSQYIKEANNRIMVFAQIETKEAVENCKEILSVPGVDGVFIGPNDLSLDLGVPGQVTSSEIFGDIKYVIQCGKELKIPTGIITSDNALIRKCRQEGMTIFSVGSETSMLLSQIKKISSHFWSDLI